MIYPFHLPFQTVKNILDSTDNFKKKSAFFCLLLFFLNATTHTFIQLYVALNHLQGFQYRQLSLQKYFSFLFILDCLATFYVRLAKRSRPTIQGRLALRRTF